MRFWKLRVARVSVSSVFRILKVFAVPMCILGSKTISRKIIWGKIFVYETVLASVAANRSLSQQVFFE